MLPYYADQRENVGVSEAACLDSEKGSIIALFRHRGATTVIRDVEKVDQENNGKK